MNGKSGDLPPRKSPVFCSTGNSGLECYATLWSIAVALPSLIGLFCRKAHDAVFQRISPVCHAREEVAAYSAAADPGSRWLAALPLRRNRDFLGPVSFQVNEKALGGL